MHSNGHVIKNITCHGAPQKLWSHAIEQYEKRDPAPATCPSSEGNVGLRARKSGVFALRPRSCARSDTVRHLLRRDGRRHGRQPVDVFRAKSNQNNVPGRFDVPETFQANHVPGHMRRPVSLRLYPVCKNRSTPPPPGAHRALDQRAACPLQQQCSSGASLPRP
jgi:hypothetical protein